ncbi:transcriptional regulator [Saccharibacillus sp. O23]|uniref:MerR family transcriptional regulator n=1 Tax=Saccharibacillus sp. O23 TaxID=2009338 RepID=UPI000B4DF495|nr:MerR family transcriptional regulator [Saccharibacillus sp. O23]OWR28998.1 transcriptional regulator [Saccharibacillus sp. O23]
MNDFLSIREFARLMGVSVHQVRYFEEKGLLMPAYAEDNGYRRYGMDELYRLSHILLLRKMGIPLAEAGRAIDEYDAEAHENLLKRSLSQIREEIGRLRQIERFTEQVLHERDRQREQKYPGYGLFEHEDRPLIRCAVLGERGEPTARMLLRAERRPSALFEADLHYVSDRNGTVLYFAPEKDEPQTAQADLVLERGIYLHERFEAFDDKEAERRIEAMARHAQERFGVRAERFILTEKSYLSLFGGESLTLELEVRVGDGSRSNAEAPGK